MIKLNLPVLFAQRGIRVADADRMSNLGRATLYRLSLHTTEILN